jgi:hypothetical protein
LRAWLSALSTSWKSIVEVMSKEEAAGGEVAPARGGATPRYNRPMATQSSFDVTSTIDFQEVDNALNQAR